MSELSEALVAALENPTEKGLLKKCMEEQTTPPGWDNLKRWTGWNTARILRPTRFYFNGKEPWETSEEAMKEVTEFVKTSVYSYMVSSLAKGMIAAIAIDNLPENYDWDELFTTSGEPRWLQAQVEAEQFITQDEEVLDVIRDHLIKNTGFFVQVSGFKDATGKETLHIYEVLQSTFKAASTSLYIAGLATGDTAKQAMILREMEQEISGFPE